jgi:hypothetical protein
VNRLATGADRLAAGSAVLVRRVPAALAAWVARGRRADLTGWRAALGPLVRAGLLLATGYVLVRIVRAVPAVLWLLAPAWLIAAWRAAPRPVAAPGPAAADEPPAPAPADPRAGFVYWLLQAIGDRPGIHLRELYPAMRTLPGQEHHDDAALRARLRALGVPVERSIRVGGVAGRSGVYRAAAMALLSPMESGTGEQGGDAGQVPDSPLLSTPGEEVKSA